MATLTPAEKATLLDAIRAAEAALDGFGTEDEELLDLLAEARVIVGTSKIAKSKA